MFEAFAFKGESEGCIFSGIVGLVVVVQGAVGMLRIRCGLHVSEGKNL
jgi:hypothetical protein